MTYVGSIATSKAYRMEKKVFYVFIDTFHILRDDVWIFYVFLSLSSSSSLQPTPQIEIEAEII